MCPEDKGSKFLLNCSRVHELHGVIFRNVSCNLQSTLVYRSQATILRRSHTVAALFGSFLLTTPATPQRSRANKNHV